LIFSFFLTANCPNELVFAASYTKSVDMWAMGCILGEMLIGKPLFPGKSTLHQIETIMEFTGRPDAEDIESVKSPFTVKMLENIPSIPHPRPLEDRFPDAAPEALDLMRKLLHFNPNKRLSVEVRQATFSIMNVNQTVVTGNRFFLQCITTRIRFKLLGFECLTSFTRILALEYSVHSASVEAPVRGSVPQPRRRARLPQDHQNQSRRQCQVRHALCFGVCFCF
jgi:serine/threonine protein kinase